jgi:hypothetical protein
MEEASAPFIAFDQLVQSASATFAWRGRLSLLFIHPLIQGIGLAASAWMVSKSSIVRAAAEPCRHETPSTPILVAFRERFLDRSHGLMEFGVEWTHLLKKMVQFRIRGLKGLQPLAEIACGRIAAPLEFSPALEKLDDIKFKRIMVSPESLQIPRKRDGIPYPVCLKVSDILEEQVVLLLELAQAAENLSKLCLSLLWEAS